MNIEPFKVSALEALSKIIGDAFTGTEITALFRKTGFSSIIHDGSTKWRFVSTTLEQLQKGNSGPVTIIKIIETMCDPQEFFLKADKHKPLCDEINKILAFYALKVGDDGKVRTIQEKAYSLKIIPENVKLSDMDSFKSAFISYQTADKGIAGILKKELSRIGITSFLAHEDIDVSEEWRRKILTELEKTELFICLLSKNYLKSPWCVQESGIAVFRSGLLVVPLSLDGTIPMGFLGDIQSKKVQSEKIELTDVAPALLKAKTGKGLSTLIEIIGASYNYRGAESHFLVISPVLHELSPAQGKRLLELSYSNDQIHNAGLCARVYVPQALKLFGHLIPPDQRDFLVSTCKRYGAEGMNN
jgi:hypothetical protein